MLDEILVAQALAVKPRRYSAHLSPVGDNGDPVVARSAGTEQDLRLVTILRNLGVPSSNGVAFNL